MVSDNICTQLLSFVRDINLDKKTVTKSYQRMELEIDQTH